METRRLGRLEHRSSVLVYGGAALGAVDQETADRSIDEALAAGINHFDVAASYGEAELRLGARTAEIRDRVFLATKTGDRDAPDARRSIEASLVRLRTDSVDLLQLHAIGDLDELDRVTRPGGALEAAVAAQEEGLVGAVGITGHGPEAAATHLEALRRYPFATVLTPLNPVLWREPGFQDAWAALVEEVQRQDAGLMTIKAVSRRSWPDAVTGEPLEPQAFATWYEPMSEPAQIRAAVSWTLAHQEVAAIATAGDVGLLRHLVVAEADRQDPAEAEERLRELGDYSSPFLAMPA